MGISATIVQIRLMSQRLCLALIAATLPVGLQAQPGPAALLPVVQQGHCQRIRRILFAPASGTNSGIVATASDDDTVRLWDLNSQQLLALCPQDGPVQYMAFSRDARTLATYGNGLLRFWDAHTGKRLVAEQLFTNSPANPNSSISDGLTLTTYVTRGQTQIWDINTGKSKRSIDWMPETFRRFGRLIQFTPDGKSLLFIREEAEEFDPTVVGARRFKLVTYELVDPFTGQSQRQLTPFEQRAEQNGTPLIAFSTPSATVGSTETPLLMAQSGEDGTTRLWNLRTGRGLPILKGNSTPTRLLTFSPDGRRLAVASGGDGKEIMGDIDLWDTSTGKKTNTLPGKPGWVANACTFMPDGQRLLIALAHDKIPEKGVSGNQAPRSIEPTLENIADCEIQAWDLTTGKILATLPAEVKITTLACSPDGTKILAGEEGGGIRIWNSRSWKTDGLFPSSRELASHTYSPDGTLLGVLADNGHVQIWETGTGRLKEAFPVNDKLGADAKFWLLMNEPTFLPDNRTLVYTVLARGSIERYDLVTHQRQTLYTPDSNAGIVAKRIQIDPNGKLMAAKMTDGKTHILEIATGRAIKTIDYDFSPFDFTFPLAAPGSGTDNGRGVQITPDGKSLVGLFESTIRIYDIATGELRKTIATGRFQQTIHLSGDGRLLAAMLDREVQLYDVESGDMKHSLKVTDGEFLFGIALSPDGKRVLTRGYQHMRVWDVETGQVIANMGIDTLSKWAQMIAQSFSEVGMTFSIDSHRVAICLPNHQVAIWNVEDGKPVAITPTVLSQFPPPFRYPVSLLVSQARIHDPRTGNILATLQAFPALTFANQDRMRQTPDPKRWLERPIAWITQTPDGYYDASPDIASYLRWNKNGALVPGEEMASIYFSPEKLRQVLALETKTELK